MLQKTFLDVWRFAGRYDPEKRFSAWLYTIAHRRAIDTLRTRRYKVVDVDTVRDLMGEDGRETAERFADAADVRAALARLSALDQEVLLLAYFEGLTQVEMAVRLDLPLGTVKSTGAARHASHGDSHAGEPGTAIGWGGDGPGRGPDAREQNRRMMDRGPVGATGHPDLAALVRGESDNEQILAAARHLDRCSRCRSELADVVTSHALLTRSSEVINGEGETKQATWPGAPGQPASSNTGRALKLGPALGAPYAAVALGAAVIVWVRAQRSRSTRALRA